MGPNADGNGLPTFYKPSHVKANAARLWTLIAEVGAKDGGEIARFGNGGGAQGPGQDGHRERCPTEAKHGAAIQSAIHGAWPGWGPSDFRARRRWPRAPRGSIRLRPGARLVPEAP